MAKKFARRVNKRGQLPTTPLSSLMKFGPNKPFLRTGISEAQKPLPTFAANLGYNGSSTAIAAFVDFADIKSNKNRQNRGFAGLQSKS